MLRLGDTVVPMYVDQSRESLDVRGSGRGSRMPPFARGHSCAPCRTACTRQADKTVYEEIADGKDEVDLGGRLINARAYCSWWGAGVEWRSERGDMREMDGAHGAAVLCPSPLRSACASGRALSPRPCLPRLPPQVQLQGGRPTEEGGLSVEPWLLSVQKDWIRSVAHVHSTTPCPPTQVGSLSGGERNRLHLAKTLKQVRGGTGRRAFGNQKGHCVIRLLRLSGNTRRAAAGGMGCCERCGSRAPAPLCPPLQAGNLLLLDEREPGREPGRGQGRRDVRLSCAAATGAAA
jgi:hypothetical protein